MPVQLGWRQAFKSVAFRNRAARRRSGRTAGEARQRGLVRGQALGAQSGDGQEARLPRGPDQHERQIETVASD